MAFQGLKVKRFFENWQDRATGTMADAPQAHERNNVTGGKYNAGYYDDYAKGTITIQLYNEGGTSGMATHKFHEVYPIGIAPIAVSWDSGDLVKLAVTFAFRDYTVGEDDGGGDDFPSLQNFGL